MCVNYYPAAPELSYILSMSNPKLRPHGSLTEWSVRPDLPLVTGTGV